MLGMLFFFIAICACLAKWSNDHDQNYTEYKKKGSDNYGCWRDGHNGWHWGNKILSTFFVNGHRILAVPDLLSCHNYDYTRYKCVVRDLTLEEEIRREVEEILEFRSYMELREKAIEEGKAYYKINTIYWCPFKDKYHKKCLRYIYRRVDNNRMYFTYRKKIYRDSSIPETEYIMQYIKTNYLDTKLVDGHLIRTPICTVSEVANDNVTPDMEWLRDLKWGFPEDM